MESPASFSSTRGDVELRWGAVTHVGKVRRLNEDAVLAAPGVFVVADGMGGHSAGDIASRLTIEAFQDVISSEPPALTMISDVVADANVRVRAYAAANGHAGMGATVVGALLVDNAGEDCLVVFNVGDARCYVLAGGELSRLTTDHSLVQELVDQGDILSDEARMHPQRNVVTRAIGIEPVVAADFVVVPTVASVRLLLCSDGVHGELPDADIAEFLRSNSGPQVVAQAIVDAVLAGPARDNITALVIDAVRAEKQMPPTFDGGIDVTGPRPVPSSQALIDDVPTSLRAPMPPPPSSLIEDVPHA